jgi:hypothetical protein
LSLLLTEIRCILRICNAVDYSRCNLGLSLFICFWGLQKVQPNTMSFFSTCVQMACTILLHVTSSVLKSGTQVIKIAFTVKTLGCCCQTVWNRGHTFCGLVLSPTKFFVRLSCPVTAVFTVMLYLFILPVHPVTNMASDMSGSVYILCIT